MDPGFFQISLKIFLQREGSFLILRDRISQRGDLPGGRLSTAEFYGDWVACVHRELREELGPELSYELHPEPLFTFPHRILSAGTDALGVAYHALHTGGGLTLSDEHDQCTWVPVDGYDPTGFFHEHMAEAVRRFQRMTGPA
jgi:8-oxo-dGTP pyrophosphatase MutT (NUDIX family)